MNTQAAQAESTVNHTVREFDNQTNTLLNTKTVEGSPTLTSSLKALIRTARSLSLHFSYIPFQEHYQRDRKDVELFIVNTRPYRDGTAREVRTEITGFRGRIGNGYRDEREVRTESGWTHQVYARTDANIYEPKHGAWSFITAAFNQHLQSCFRLLPVGTALHFTVLLDQDTNTNHVKAQLHGDLLSLRATLPQGKRRREVPPVVFTLDSVVAPHNSSRFGNPGTNSGNE